MEKNIICFLTVTPSPLFYRFAKKLENENTDVYICIDKNDYNIPDYDNKIKIIKMDENICKAAGFKNTVLWCQKRACSRDKALYYFCTNNIPFKHLWFIEEDVFIPTIHTIENINKKYPTGDLLCKSNGIVYERRTDWNWPIVNKKIRNMAPPYSTSLVCAIRVSRKMLNVINFYVKKYKTLFLDEALFPTMALKARLEIVNPDELSTIDYDYDWKKCHLNSNNLFHPVKDIIKQYKFRRYIHKNLLVTE